MLNYAANDYYRCPKGFMDFELDGELSHDAGFFKFGADLTCYGRSCFGSRQTQPDLLLSDLAELAQPNVGNLTLPFDPNEIIDNLRQERYVEQSGRTREILRKLYYLIRPAASPSLRRTIQRLNMRNWHNSIFPHWPVDTTVETLCERLMCHALKSNSADRVPFVWFWPDGARGCVTMTHDVESTAGHDFCRHLMDLDDAAGIKASFQIVPEQRYPVDFTLLEEIRERGFEVGVQDLNHDGRLFDSREEFLRRAKAINQYGRKYGARGFRAAVLYRNQEWLEHLDFAFDMSIPNAAHLDPQRGGCCTVMPFFIGDILELPVTTTQDYTLFHLLKHRSIDLWKTQTELILAKNGLVSFIVHPDYLLHAELRALYLQLLEYLQSQRGLEHLWFALPSDIERWWTLRNRLSVERDGGRWRIVGEGSERAVLAFAQVRNGRLTYDLDGSTADSPTAEVTGRAQHSGVRQ
jgi:hypothetical protein